MYIAYKPMPLKFTKNQILILEKFFNDSEKSYYLHEMGRLIGKKPGVFQRDINKLVENGILDSNYQANSRFFKLNKQYPLYAEIKSIFFKTIGIEKKLKDALKEIKNIEIAFIFGSFARNNEDSISDVDLMIIGNPDENLLVVKISKIESLIDREINYHIFSLNDWREKIKENNSFLKNICSRPKIFLIGNQNELSKIN
jgi:predicted nucleotidyltransferase